ncbi:MAG: hypothetical protein JNM04_07860 [Chthonomonas sp.]|nr:hypothetical protein [Chthonomonas sp.]
MRPLARQWTLQRKLLGNLLPVFASLPFWVVWLWRVGQKGVLDPAGLGLLALAIVCSWLALNCFGWPGNSKMRIAIGRAYNAERGIFTGPRWFVGMATPAYRNPWDPHEDIGFLVLHDDRIEFFGERIRLALPHDCLTGIGRRANAHSWVGIGGWLCIEGTLNGQDVRLLIEPRERNLIVHNRTVAKQIKAEIQKRIAPAPNERGGRSVLLGEDLSSKQ